MQHKLLLKVSLLARAVVKALRITTPIEIVYDKYARTHPCKRRSIMVCKSCAASDMERVTFTATEQG